MGRGAALMVLGELRTEDALPRLRRAVRTRSLQTAAVRDGAIQGLAALGTREARRELRDMLSDPERRAPRVAHALLRAVDVRSSDALRAVALDPDALVEMRLAAANAHTLLAPGRDGVAEAWIRGLARAGPIGSPFEALDHRLGTFHARLALAERCGRDRACWVEATRSLDPQTRARAFWQLPRLPPDDTVTEAYVQAALETLEITPPNERHDAVAGAITVLRFVDAAKVRAHVGLVRRARVAWEGRTNPMGLPFDIPLALRQLEGHVAGDDPP